MNHCINSSCERRNLCSLYIEHCGCEECKSGKSNHINDCNDTNSFALYKNRYNVPCTYCASIVETHKPYDYVCKACRDYGRN